MTLLLHLSLSWLGFNPTDDGFTLAYSRRLLDGQIPHRDFIIIRPALSPILHIPWVAWGGDRTFLIARLFVIFQFVMIAFCWTSLVNRQLGLALSRTAKFGLSLLGVCGTIQYCLLMPWHTVDGLFLLSLGLVLGVKENQMVKCIGCALIGMSVLCKQSFLIAVPVSIGLLISPTSLRCWGACLLPSALYGVVLWSTGAISDAILQLASLQGFFLHIGFKKYINTWFLAGFVTGGLVAALSLVRNRFSSLHWVRVLCLEGQKFGLVIFPLVLIPMALMIDYGYQFGFSIFGLLAAYGFGISFDAEFRRPALLKLIAVTLVIAWSSSLSLAVNTPLTFLGQMLTTLIGIAWVIQKQYPSRWFSPALIACGLLMVGGFVIIRWDQVHTFMCPIQAQTWNLKGVLRGASGIYTDQNTYRELADLRSITDRLTQAHKPYVIITDHAAHWVGAPVRNPLSIDWPQVIELQSPQLQRRVERELFNGRGTFTVIVTRYNSFELCLVPTPPPVAVTQIFIPFVQKHFTKVQTTEFFELYN